MFVLSVVDSSMVFFLPLAIDSSVIVVSARHSNYFWLIPLLAAAGSVAGAAVTYWIGRRVGEEGLERFVSEQRLEKVRDSLGEKGAFAIALPALIPPPFPFTPFILASGALEVNSRNFFLALAGARLLRFEVEGILAHFYGDWILDQIESEQFKIAVIAFSVVAIAGTVFSAYRLWRSTR